MIQEFRKQKGYTQSSLAKELGVSQQSVSNYENGSREPPIAILIALSDLFGCTIDELVRGGEKSEL